MVAGDEGAKTDINWLRNGRGDVEDWGADGELEIAAAEVEVGCVEAGALFCEAWTLVVGVVCCTVGEDGLTGDCDGVELDAETGPVWESLGG